VGAVVVKDGGNVLAGEGVGCVRNQKTCLSDGSVSDCDALDGLHGGCGLGLVADAGDAVDEGKAGDEVPFQPPLPLDEQQENIVKGEENEMNQRKTGF